MKYATYKRQICGANTAVLFIHGFLGSPKHFNEFIPLVPKNYTIYNLLLDGHGGKVRDFSRASMKIWKSQVQEALDELLKSHKEIIIAAHSMGTLFSYEAAVKYPDRIKALFLLGSPLKIGVKLTAVINTLKSFFNIISDDEVGIAYKNSHSIELEKKPWLYIGWIPRYLELFSEAKKGREVIKSVEVPSFIFQSEKDELVSIKSVKFIPEKENIKLRILKNSRHFIYGKEDMAELKQTFSSLL